MGEGAEAVALAPDGKSIAVGRHLRIVPLDGGAWLELRSLRGRRATHAIEKDGSAIELW